MTDFSSNAGGSGIGSSATLSAFFDGRSEADRAMERLRAAGVSDDRIRLTEGGESVASGSTASSTSSASGRSGDRGFFESLGDLHLPQEDRHAYAEGLSRGGYLVTVSGLSTEQYDVALDILDDEGAVDLDEREASWRSEGWSGYAGGEAAFTNQDRVLGEGETVPVVHEELRVGKRDVNLGRVRVRSYVREVPVDEQVELRREHVSIERRPVDRPVTGADDAFRERSIEAEERGEEAVVSKEARVVEEVGLRRDVETHRETITDTVRHTEVEIEDERVDRGGAGSTGSGADTGINRR